MNSLKTKSLRKALFFSSKNTVLNTIPLKSEATKFSCLKSFSEKAVLSYAHRITCFLISKYKLHYTSTTRCPSLINYRKGKKKKTKPKTYFHTSTVIPSQFPRELKQILKLQFYKVVTSAYGNSNEILRSRDRHECESVLQHAHFFGMFYQAKRDASPAIWTT